MSAVGKTVPAAVPQNVWTVIENDFKSAETWAAAEFQSVALTVWTIFKTSVLAITAGEAQVVINALGRLQSDLVNSKSIEQIETDLLNGALADEITVLTSIGSKTLQALIAAWKAS